jgi:hypothetical protein
MTEFKHVTFGMAVNINAEELDRPRIIRGPWWRNLLVKAGVLQPIYGETLREEMHRAKRGRYQQMQIMREEMARHLSGNPYANTPPR